ncbi:MAG: hypothetical protein ACYC5N_00765, partial [Endomicrobiales bacterium]
IYDQEGILKISPKIPLLEYYLIANDGIFVVFGFLYNRIGGPGSINFFNNRGELIKCIPAKTDSIYFSPIRALFSPNDRFIVFQIESFQEERKNINDYTILLLCFDTTGKEFWKLELNDLNNIGLRASNYTAPFEQMEISDDSKKILLRGSSRKYHKKMTWIINDRGKLIEEKEGGW